jgi:hypothetical protein
MFWERLMAAHLGLVPLALTVGDSASFQLSVPGLSSSDGWSATLTWRTTIGVAVTVTGVASGGGWTFLLTTAVSATLTPGTNRWELVCSKAPDRMTVGVGQTLVRLSLAAGSPPETQTFAQLEAVFFQLAKGSVTVQVDAWHRTFITLEDWQKAYDKAKQAVLNEQIEAAVAAGLGNQRKIYGVFVQPRA